MIHPKTVAGPVVLACLLLAPSLFGQDDDWLALGSISEFRNRPDPEPENVGFSYCMYANSMGQMNLKELEYCMGYMAKRVELLKQYRPDDHFELWKPLPATFQEELESRMHFHSMLRENQKELGAFLKKYLHDLDAVADAKFFKEYVFRFHHQKAWDAEAASLDLRLDEFDSWARKNLAAHKPLLIGDVTANPDNEAVGFGVLIEKEGMTNPEGAFWMRYGMQRAAFRIENKLRPGVLVGQEVVPTVDEELTARLGQCEEEHWNKFKDLLSDATRRSFEALQRADKAGFAKEFIWTYCRRESWEQPNGLRLDEFRKWAESEIGDHPERAPTSAILFGRIKISDARKKGKGANEKE